MSAELDTVFESPLGRLSHEVHISIHDFTKKNRWGLRGNGAAEALRIRGWDLPEQPNQLGYLNKRKSCDGPESA